MADNLNMYQQNQYQKQMNDEYDRRIKEQGETLSKTLWNIATKPIKEGRMPTYNTSLSLTEESQQMRIKCNESGYSVADIFRLGLQEALEQIEMGEASEKGEV